MAKVKNYCKVSTRAKNIIWKVKMVSEEIIKGECDTISEAMNCVNDIMLHLTSPNGFCGIIEGFFPESCEWREISRSWNACEWDCKEEEIYKEEWKLYK